MESQGRQGLRGHAHATRATYRLKRGNPQEKAELVSPGGLGAVKE